MAVSYRLQQASTSCFPVMHIHSFENQQKLTKSFVKTNWHLFTIVRNGLINIISLLLQSKLVMSQRTH